MSTDKRYESETVDPAILGETIVFPFTGLKAKSRFLKSAMSERISSWDQTDLSKRGIPPDEMIHVYEEWGKSGFGLILTGNVIVNPVDLETPGNAVVYKPFETAERVSAFARLAAAAKRHGSLCMMQLSHAGRQVTESVNPHPVSASDVQLMPSLDLTFGKPTPLTHAGIDEVIEQFVYGAEFAHKTGFDGVQLHCAHGYLLAQFLAQTTNKRTDKYGGELHNRARIIYRIVEEIKRRITDRKFSVGVKINSVEFQQGGFQPEECREVCRRLQDIGVDFVELSGGTYENFDFLRGREASKEREAFFLEFADVISAALDTTKVFVTGRFRTAGGMVAAIRSSKTDGIGLARPICEEPNLPKLLIEGRVAGARKTLFDETDVGFTGMVAGAQIAQLGRGQIPFDTTDPKQVAVFKEEFGTYRQRIQKLASQGIIEAGFPRYDAERLL